MRMRKTKPWIAAGMAAVMLCGCGTPTSTAPSSESAGAAGGTDASADAVSEYPDYLNLDSQRYALDLVLALGKPKEKVVIVPVGPDGNTQYYRDEEQVHYVPKRDLNDILL